METSRLNTRHSRTNARGEAGGIPGSPVRFKRGGRGTGFFHPAPLRAWSLFAIDAAQSHTFDRGEAATTTDTGYIVSFVYGRI